MVEPSGVNPILIVKGANTDLSPADVERTANALKTCHLILLQFEVPAKRSMIRRRPQVGRKASPRRSASAQFARLAYEGRSGEGSIEKAAASTRASSAIRSR